jgi:hypothetical protein
MAYVSARPTVPITVAVPVGPHPSNRFWLEECLVSINEQTVAPAEVLLIDDQAGLEDITGVFVWKTPWLVGVAHAFNFGVALAQNDLVIMLGSDDKLLPRAVETAWAKWQEIRDPLGYYGFLLEYNNGKLQNTACNAAMVHKQLWKHTGGFPVESSIGACDTWLLSLIVLGEGRLGNLYQIGHEPLYWYRQHEETDTARRGEMWSVVEQARDIWLRRKMGRE